jgi:uncharacterized protein (TIGR03118 family)
VTYAKQDANAEDDSPGLGNGFVDIFDTSGNLVKRLVSQGNLNSPWGLAKAPSNFGSLSNALLVGNFGNGLINAYDPVSGASLGMLLTPGGTPIAIDGAWGLQFGNGLSNQATNTLFFAAGPSDEAHGLFGRIDVAPVPEPGAILLVIVSGCCLALKRGRRAWRVA